MQPLRRALQPIIDRVRTDVSAIKTVEGAVRGNQPTPINDDMLAEHLNGGSRCGAYHILPGQDTTRIAILDLDDHDKVMTIEEIYAAAEKVARAALKHSCTLRPHLWSSSSGHGVHIIFLWDAPQDAYSVRQLMSDVLVAAGYKAKGGGSLVNGEIEVFPKQSSVPEGGYGNFTWLPLSGASVPLVDGGFVCEGLRATSKELVAEHGYEWAMSEGVPTLEKTPGELSFDNPKTPTGVDLVHIKELLAVISPDGERDEWRNIGMAIHFESGGSDEGLNVWDEWSADGVKYPGRHQMEYQWNSFGSEGKASLITIRSIEHMARELGWREDVGAMFEVIESGEGGSGATKALPSFERNKAGLILPSTDNILMALERSDICGGRIGYDDFTDELMMDESCDRERRGVCHDEWRAFTDADYTSIKRQLELKGQQGFAPIARTELKECVHYTGDRQRFDSAQLWLRGLEWDGTPRIENFLSGYVGAQDTVYTKAVSYYIWTALAGRVLDPGCQADMAPILVGEQGERKTSALKAMVPDAEYFCEVDFSEKEDDIARKLRGVLIAELAELRGLNSRDADHINAFITRRVEKWVPKYKEFTATSPRRTLFIGTTNHTEFLADPYGNRRWLPVNVGRRAGEGRVIDTDAIVRDRDQLWAEAAHLFEGKAGEGSGVMWEEAERLAREEHAAFAVSHPWEDKIVTWLHENESMIEVVVPKGKGRPRKFISNTQLFSHILDLRGRITGADGRELARVMSRLGYEKRQTRSHRGWWEKE